MNFSALRASVKLQEQYLFEISNRFAALFENIYSASIQKGYDKLIEIVYKTNRSVQREKCISEKADNMMLEQKETHRNFRNHRNDQNYLPWR